MNKDLVKSMVNYGLDVLMDDSSDQKELFEAFAQVFVMIQNNKEPSKDLINSAIELVHFMEGQCNIVLDFLTAMYEQA